MKTQSFVFIGPSGSGKGTQANLLIEALQNKTGMKVLHVETGKEFREFKQKENFSAKLTAETIDQGNFMPEFMCVLMWGNYVVNNFTGKEHLVFDGTSRRIVEAQALNNLFSFYKLEKPWVIYLNVHFEESKTRLLLRGRNDDTADGIRNRYDAYVREVLPVVEYYKKNDMVNFLDINGVGKIEDIHADIVKKMGLK